jgi:hypothetical protein
MDCNLLKARILLCTRNGPDRVHGHLIAARPHLDGVAHGRWKLLAQHAGHDAVGERAVPGDAQGLGVRDLLKDGLALHERETGEVPPRDGRRVHTVSALDSFPQRLAGGMVDVVTDDALRKPGEDVAPAHRVISGPLLRHGHRRRCWPSAVAAAAAGKDRRRVVGEHVRDAGAMEGKEHRLLPPQVTVGSVQRRPDAARRHGIVVPADRGNRRCKQSRDEQGRCEETGEERLDGLENVEETVNWRWFASETKLPSLHFGQGVGGTSAFVVEGRRRMRDLRRFSNSKEGTEPLWRPVWVAWVVASQKWPVGCRIYDPFKWVEDSRRATE